MFWVTGAVRGLIISQLTFFIQAKAFSGVWAASGDGNDPKHEAAIEAAFAKMRTCLDDFEAKARAQKKGK